MNGSQSGLSKAILEYLGNLLGLLDHDVRELEHLRHVDAVGSINDSFFHLVKHGEPVALGEGADEQILDSRDLRLHLSHLVEVSGEEAVAAELSHDVLGDGPRQAEALVSRGASSELAAGAGT